MPTLDNTHWVIFMGGQLPLLSIPRPDKFNYFTIKTIKYNIFILWGCHNIHMPICLEECYSFKVKYLVFLSD